MPGGGQGACDTLTSLDSSLNALGDNPVFRLVYSRASFALAMRMSLINSVGVLFWYL